MGHKRMRGAASTGPIAMGSLRARVAAVLIALGCVAALGVLPPQPSQAAVAAVAADYPTWNDVKKAQRDEAAAKKAVAQIKALLKQLEARVASTMAEAEEKGAIFAEKQAAYDEKAYEAQQLQEQVDAAQEEADNAKRAAAQFIAGLARNGDTTAMTLMTQAGDVDELLNWLGTSKKYSETHAAVFTRALQFQQSAEALQEQAQRGQEILAVLKAEAEEAFEEAQAAAIAAQDAYAEEQDNRERLEAQLVAITEKRKNAEEEYEKGLREQWGKNASGYISPSGWANPTFGCITSHFGMRFHPKYHVWKLHSGTDIGCGGFNAPIYAAHAGTVTYAGPYSDLGNYVVIQHPNGIKTGYAHINYGGIKVRVGQQVGPGQLIALVGSTGGSTGPHLHFMVYRHGVLQNPMTFMREQGIQLGG